MNCIIYVTENNKIYKAFFDEIKNVTPLEALKFKINLPHRAFVLSCYYDGQIRRLRQENLNPLEAFYQVYPYSLNLNNISKDDFRGQNEDFIFYL